jgi:hypothetical protein
VKFGLNIINGDAVVIDFAVHGPWRTVHCLSGQKKILCEISGFRRHVVVVCALRSCCVASVDKMFVTGPTFFPETSVNKYQLTPRNIPEERRLQEISY